MKTIACLIWLVPLFALLTSFAPAISPDAYLAALAETGCTFESAPFRAQDSVYGDAPLKDVSGHVVSSARVQIGLYAAWSCTSIADLGQTAAALDQQVRDRWAANLR